MIANRRLNLNHLKLSVFELRQNDIVKGRRRVRNILFVQLSWYAGEISHFVLKFLIVSAFQVKFVDSGFSEDVRLGTF